MLRRWFIAGLAFALLLSACRPPAASPQGAAAPLKVLAVENYLADIAQNIAGSRLKVEALMPLGVDPHSFEPAPQDIARVAESTVLIVNGAGLEGFLTKMLDNAGGNRRVIEAAAGLTSRATGAGEVTDPGQEGDPHFWLDPNYAIRYVENLRDGLSQVDPAGAAVYAENAQQYIAQLADLDRWVKEQVAQIPPANRLLVTNHESFGYLADRYGFTIVGTVIPSVSTGSSPSAQQLAQLIDHIKASDVKAVFLETGANPQLAEQIAQETNAKVVADLYTHSLSDPGGPAPTYIAMIRYDIKVIVEALR
jgi:ABC-type Zn uptake system ZnuABC Zn-binding protein ZnuA